MPRRFVPQSGRRATQQSQSRAASSRPTGGPRVQYEPLPGRRHRCARRELPSTTCGRPSVASRRRRIRTLDLTRRKAPHQHRAPRHTSNSPPRALARTALRHKAGGRQRTSPRLMRTAAAPGPARISLDCAHRTPGPAARGCRAGGVPGSRPCAVACWRENPKARAPQRRKAARCVHACVGKGADRGTGRLLRCAQGRRCSGPVRTEGGSEVQGRRHSRDATPQRRRRWPARGPARRTGLGLQACK